MYRRVFFGPASEFFQESSRCSPFAMLINQSISQSDSQSVRQSVSQTVSQSDSQSVSQSVSQPVKCCPFSLSTAPDMYLKYRGAGPVGDIPSSSNKITKTGKFGSSCIFNAGGDTSAYSTRRACRRGNLPPMPYGSAERSPSVRCCYSVSVAQYPVLVLVLAGRVPSAAA
jgi:hypothetical protein